MKIMNILGAILMITAASMADEPFNKSHVSVGSIRVDTRVGGIYSFGLANGDMVDSRCTKDPTTLWPATSNLDGNKSILEVLLTAKAMTMTVTLSYSIDANGNCLINQVTLE